MLKKILFFLLIFNGIFSHTLKIIEQMFLLAKTVKYLLLKLLIFY